MFRGGAVAVMSDRDSEKYFSVLIEKKVAGEELNDDEIRDITDAVMSGTISDSQLSAFLMAVYFQNMSIQETSTWTEELMLSGDIIDCGNTNRFLC